MPITAITIENFKGIRESVRVELKPITLLFGPNSAGKSTIVQALHYAREIFERQNLDPDRTLLGGETVDLGGFESLVHQHDLKLPIKIGFELDLSNEDLPSYFEGDEAIKYLGTATLDHEAPSAFLLDTVSRVRMAMVEVTIIWSEQFSKPYVGVYEVQANGEELIKLESSPDGKRVYISSINPFNPVFFEESVSERVKEMAVSIFGKYFGKEPKTQNFHDELTLNDLGETFPVFVLFTGALASFASSRAIELEGQESCLPCWGKNLMLDRTIWSEDTDVLDQLNLIRLLSTLTVGPGELVRDGLRQLCYVGPIRKVPKREHRPLSTPEESRWANGSAAYDTLFHGDDDFIDKVNEWFTQEDRLNAGYRVEVKKYRELEEDNPLMLAVLQDRILDEDIDLREGLLSLPLRRRLLIRDEISNIELSPQDIGVGISQVLPVIVAALHYKRGIVAIEQPELHIHPAFQVALGDLFIEQVRKHPDLTFILETHSEHLMLRFLRRIRETSEKEAPEARTLTPEELAVYFIEQGETGIFCLPIRVDEDGDFMDRWPHGFFSERARELF